MGRSTEVVRAFIDAWSARDVDRIMRFFTPDAVYHNIPMEPAKGFEAIRKTIEGFAGMASAIEFVVHNSAETADGRIVMNERTDRFKIGERWIEAPVMGTFELDGEKIRAWRDYFDMAMFTKAMQG